MKKNYSFKVDINTIEITPELKDHFKQTNSKVVRTVAPINEVKGILTPEEIASFPSEQRVLIRADYENGNVGVMGIQNYYAAATQITNNLSELTSYLSKSLYNRLKVFRTEADLSDITLTYSYN